MGSTSGTLAGATVPEADGANYSREWRAYAVRRGLALFLLFGWAPACVTMFLLSRLWLHQPELMLILMGVWGVLAYAAIFWAGETRCPRCRRRFGALGSKKGFGTVWRGLFDRICSNCKLRRWEHGVDRRATPRP